MTPEQIRARSVEKVKQVTDLMKLLHLRQECKERVDRDGFIEKQIVFVDDEQYPTVETTPTEPTSPEIVEGGSDDELASEDEDVG